MGHACIQDMFWVCRSRSICLAGGIRIDGTKGLGSRHSLIPGALAGARERWGATRPRLFFVVVAGVPGADVAFFVCCQPRGGQPANVPTRIKRPSCSRGQGSTGSFFVGRVTCYLLLQKQLDCLRITPWRGTWNSMAASFMCSGATSPVRSL